MTRLPGADEPRLSNPYSVVLCGPDPEATSVTWLAVTEMRPVIALRQADTVVVPGCEDPQQPVPEKVHAELRSASALSSSPPPIRNRARGEGLDSAGLVLSLRYG